MLAVYTSTPDASLISLFLSGENAAFEALLNRHKDRVYTAIYLLVKDRPLAEDLFQDCFLKILCTMREGRYDEQGKFLPWALRVAHNLCIDYFRKSKTQGVILIGDEAFASGRCESCVPETRLEKQQTKAGLYQLIDRLPLEQRTVLVMRIYGELSFKEIGEATGVSINTALGRMRYALLNLRKMMRTQESNFV